MESAREKVHERKFALTSETIRMPQGGVRMIPVFSLTKTESLYVATKFNDEARAKRAMAEAYFDNKLKDASVNVQRKQKTREGFERLPEEFTTEDVMRRFNLSTDGAVRSKTRRLIKDHLIEKNRRCQTGR